MKLRSKLAVSLSLLAIPLVLAGCAGGENYSLSMEQQTHGLPLTINTYDFHLNDCAGSHGF